MNQSVNQTEDHLHDYEKPRTGSKSQRGSQDGEFSDSESDTESKIESPAWLDDTTKDYASLVPKLHNYISTLELKYSYSQPEISNNGDYIGNKTWIIDHLEYGISGTVKDGTLKIPLIFETYWYPLNSVSEAAQFVQLQADTITKNQYKSLCIINDVWDDEIKKWATDFFHQRMSLFLYELENDTLTFNYVSDTINRFMPWHSNDMFKSIITEEMEILIDKMEYIMVSDVMGMFGFNTRGAEEYLYDFMKKGKILDVGLDSPKYKKVKH